MTARYVLSREAARDLVLIWGYVRNASCVATANAVEALIRQRLVFLAVIQELVTGVPISQTSR